MLGLASTSSPPLIIQLQEAAMDQSASVSALLTKTKVAASKLRLGQILEWICLEISGYGDREVPDYRAITAAPKLFNPYNGLIPIFSDNHEFMRLLSIAKTGQSVTELESLLNGASHQFQMRFPPKLQAYVQSQTNMPVPMQGSWVIGSNQIQGILNTVRQRVLDWSLELENAGVLGDGLTFSATEKAAAMNVTNNFHGSNIGVIGNISDQANVANSQTATHAPLTKADIASFADQVRANAQQLPSSIQNQIAEPLSILDGQAGSETPNQSKVIGALKSIRAVCEGASSNLVASGILALIASLLGG